MQLGIFAKTFVRASFEEGFAMARNYGLECVQFNLSCAGLPTLPEALEPALLHRIRSALVSQGLSMAAVSGTCNLIHPNSAQRARDLANLETLLRSCRALGTSVVTLCTGSRDAANMWRRHPENCSSEAWHDLEKALDRLLPIAEEQGLVLGVEPEPANVIDSAPRARRLLDELKSPYFKIVFDAANLLQPDTLSAQQQVLAEGVDLLGSDIVIAHAKDLQRKPPLSYVAAGQGALDYHAYLSLLKNAGFDGPLILHSLAEAEVGAAVAFVRSHFETLRPRATTKKDALLPPRQP